MAAEDQPSTDPDATRLLPRAEPQSSLPSGTRLREFEVERVVGEGGFSIVYAAVDINLRRRVALKEYMPTSLARRCDDRTVQPRSERDSETFDLGRRSFINEARLLARFDHPALVKVHQFWEENGTAYMVMPLYQGRTLKHWLMTLGRPPTEEELKDLVAPLLEALEHLHAENVFHRDIAPDNILLLDDGKPVLLDFGAARQVLVDSNTALTAILKPSYAPIEQYADMAQLRQGAWTDIYALCAVLYFAITGAAPPSAIARSISDKMATATKAGGGRYSARFLRAIDAGLTVRPEGRPQSVGQFRELLLQEAPATVRRSTRSNHDREPSDSASRWRSHWALAAFGVGALLLAGGVGVWITIAAPGAGRLPAVAEPVVKTSPRLEAAKPASASQPEPLPPRTGDEMPSAKTDTTAPVSDVLPASSEANRPARPPTMTATPTPVTISPPPARRAESNKAETAAALRHRTEPVRGVESEPPARTAPAASARARCLQILQRMQLGEFPTAEEKAYLKRECT